METTMCQCEDKYHFPTEEEDGTSFDHLYGKVPATTEVITIFGKFKVCERCVKHMQGKEVN